MSFVKVPMDDWEAAFALVGHMLRRPVKILSINFQNYKNTVVSLDRNLRNSQDVFITLGWKTGLLVAVFRQQAECTPVCRTHTHIYTYVQHSYARIHTHFLYTILLYC